MQDCQKDKLDGKGYKLLPMRDLKEQPFEEVAVDLIDPWKVQVGGKPCEFNALSAIDTVTNLVEIVCIDKRTSEHIITSQPDLHNLGWQGILGLSAVSMIMEANL